MYGWGDNWAGTSSGIDEIAARARTIPGVTQVNVRNYWETQRVYDEVVASPTSDRVVVGGYSCGLNAATVVARGLWQAGRTAHTVVGIQQSVWCGGDALESNVKYGQSTYNADCWDTGGLGCKPLEPAPSFLGKIVNINRIQGHGAADNDPDTQQDVLKAIAATSLYGRVPPPPPHIQHPIPPEVSTGPIVPPSRPPIAAGIDCRWAWSSNRGWAVLCSRPDSRVRNIVRYRGQRAF
jgi:hypothetical protein